MKFRDLWIPPVIWIMLLVTLVGVLIYQGACAETLKALHIAYGCEDSTHLLLIALRMSQATEKERQALFIGPLLEGDCILLKRGERVRVLDSPDVGMDELIKVRRLKTGETLWTIKTFFK